MNGKQYAKLVAERRRASERCWTLRCERCDMTYEHVAPSGDLIEPGVESVVFNHNCGVLTDTETHVHKLEELERVFSPDATEKEESVDR